jgi:xylose isomerase
MSKVKEFFPGIPAVQFEGSYASHPFSFRFYDPERIVAGKPMREQLRFALPVGAAARFGHAGQDYLMASMELLHKLGLQLYTLRDRNLAPEAPTLRESNARMDEAAEALLCLQEAYGARALQVSADLCSHPRYCYGAATSYSADIYAHAAAQAKKALELAWRLGALQFCFSGEQECRDGFYPSVNDALEMGNLLRLLAMLAGCAAETGYTGTLCVRPGGEPAREPYLPTASQVLAFLRGY